MEGGGRGALGILGFPSRPCYPLLRLEPIFLALLGLSAACIPLSPGSCLWICACDSFLCPGVLPLSPSLHSLHLCLSLSNSFFPHLFLCLVLSLDFSRSFHPSLVVPPSISLSLPPLSLPPSPYLLFLSLSLSPPPSLVLPDLTSAAPCPLPLSCSFFLCPSLHPLAVSLCDCFPCSLLFCATTSFLCHCPWWPFLSSWFRGCLDGAGPVEGCVCVHVCVQGKGLWWGVVLGRGATRKCRTWTQVRLRPMVCRVLPCAQAPGGGSGRGPGYGGSEWGGVFRAWSQAPQAMLPQVSLWPPCAAVSLATWDGGGVVFWSVVQTAEPRIIPFTRTTVTDINSAALY